LEDSVSDHKYSVAEIDRMRAAAFKMTGWNEHDPCELGQRASRAEDKLRTYMLNGTSPGELEDAASTIVKGIWEQRAARDRAILAKQAVCEHNFTHENRANFKECLKCGKSVMDSEAAA
jgi:hypothetical protein